MVEKRNIILITFDSLRADHCSFMGYHRKTTPTLDKIARRGIYFEDAIISVPGTTSSMMGIFTGEYAIPDFNNLIAHSWEKEVSNELTSMTLKKRDTWISKYWKSMIKSKTTLAQILSDIGYNTAAFHANPAVCRYFGFNKGFSHFQDYMQPRFSERIEKYISSIFTKFGLSGLYRGISDYLKSTGVFMTWEKMYYDIIKWINTTEDYFFVWILLMDTHAPYLPPNKYRKWCRSWEIYKVNWKLFKGGFTRPKFNESERLRVIDAYDDSIRYADNFVNHLIKDISNRDPIIIVHGDHGEGFGDHGYYGHPQMLYEDLIHVPLIIYNSDMSQKIKEIFSLLNFRKLVSYLLGTDIDIHDLCNKYAVSEAYGNKISVRTKTWKYIYSKTTEELYNLNSDPYEKNNLHETNSDLIKVFRQITRKHIKQRKIKSVVKSISTNLKI